MPRLTWTCGVSEIYLIVCMVKMIAKAIFPHHGCLAEVVDECVKLCVDLRFSVSRVLDDVAFARCK